MQIKKLTLSNFRSFKEPQSIEFAPVTLLFGKNSVGKSSVLMALYYLQQILNKGHCDPLHLDAMSDRLIGGFKSLVHGGSLNESIRIKVEFEVGGTIGTEYETYAESMEFKEEYVDEKTGKKEQRIISLLSLPDIASESEYLSVEFSISWSNENQTAYVSEYKVDINNEYIGSISSDSSQKYSFISELNLEHSLLKPGRHSEWLEEQFGESKERADDYFLTQFEQIYQELAPSRLFDRKSVEKRKDDSAFDHVKDQLNDDARDYKVPRKLRVPPVPVSCVSGSIPLLGKMLETRLDGNEVENSSEHLNHLIITRALTQIFVSPLDKLKVLLDKSVCIGPLRVIPDEHFQPNLNPEQKDWMDGTAAWDLLYRSKDITKKVSDWFSSENKFDSGYEIVHTTPRDEFKRVHSEVLASPDLNKWHRQRFISWASDETEVFFKEKKLGMRLYPNQLGVGISQVLPVVVAAHSVKGGVVSIEQPELHIHPSFQVELGDLFTQLDVSKSSKPMFLIETHSEHIMLRLRKRIRQTTDDELDNGVKAVSKNDIAINYLAKGREGLIVKRIHLDEDGEFIDRWPKGFYSERMQELI